MYHMSYDFLKTSKGSSCKNKVKSIVWYFGKHQLLTCYKEV